MIASLPGFLGTRASLMLDVVFVAMFVVLPVLGFSVYLVRYRRLYWVHKRIQLSLGAILLVTVGLFEWDMRVNGWEHLAVRPGESEPAPRVYWALWVHLMFAVSTAFLWVLVMVRALRNFPVPPMPGPHSRFHLFWARLAAADMVLTAVTGWVFYVLAFVL